MSPPPPHPPTPPAPNASDDDDFYRSYIGGGQSFKNSREEENIKSDISLYKSLARDPAYGGQSAQWAEEHRKANKALREFQKRDWADRTRWRADKEARDRVDKARASSMEGRERVGEATDISNDGRTERRAKSLDTPSQQASFKEKAAETQEKPQQQQGPHQANLQAMSMKDAPSDAQPNPATVVKEEPAIKSEDIANMKTDSIRIKNEPPPPAPVKVEDEPLITDSPAHVQSSLDHHPHTLPVELPKQVGAPAGFQALPRPHPSAPTPSFTSTCRFDSSSCSVVLSDNDALLSFNRPLNTSTAKQSVPVPPEVPHGEETVVSGKKDRSPDQLRRDSMLTQAFDPLLPPSPEPPISTPAKKDRKRSASAAGLQTSPNAPPTIENPGASRDGVEDDEPPRKALKRSGTGSDEDVKSASSPKRTIFTKAADRPTRAIEPRPTSVLSVKGSSSCMPIKIDDEPDTTFRYKRRYEGTESAAPASEPGSVARTPETTRKAASQASSLSPQEYAASKLQGRKAGQVRAQTVPMAGSQKVDIAGPRIVRHSTGAMSPPVSRKLSTPVREGMSVMSKLRVDTGVVGVPQVETAAVRFGKGVMEGRAGDVALESMPLTSKSEKAPLPLVSTKKILKVGNPSVAATASHKENDVSKMRSDESPRTPPPSASHTATSKQTPQTLPTTKEAASLPKPRSTSEQTPKKHDEVVDMRTPPSSHKPTSQQTEQAPPSGEDVGAMSIGSLVAPHQIKEVQTPNVVRYAQPSPERTESTANIQKVNKPEQHSKANELTPEAPKEGRVARAGRVPEQPEASIVGVKGQGEQKEASETREVAMMDADTSGEAKEQEASFYDILSQKIREDKIWTTVGFLAQRLHRMDAEIKMHKQENGDMMTHMNSRDAVYENDRKQFVHVKKMGKEVVETVKQLRKENAEQAKQIEALEQTKAKQAEIIAAMRKSSNDKDKVIKDLKADHGKTKSALTRAKTKIENQEASVKKNFEDRNEAVAKQAALNKDKEKAEEKARVAQDERDTTFRSCRTQMQKLRDSTAKEKAEFVETIAQKDIELAQKDVEIGEKEEDMADMRATIADVKGKFHASDQERRYGNTLKSIIAVQAYTLRELRAYLKGEGENEGLNFILRFIKAMMESLGDNWETSVRKGELKVERLRQEFPNCDGFLEVTLDDEYEAPAQPDAWQMSPPVTPRSRRASSSTVDEEDREQWRNDLDQREDDTGVSCTDALQQSQSWIERPGDLASSQLEERFQTPVEEMNVTQDEPVRHSVQSDQFELSKQRNDEPALEYSSELTSNDDTILPSVERMAEMQFGLSHSASTADGISSGQPMPSDFEMLDPAPPPRARLEWPIITSNTADGGPALGQSSASWVDSMQTHASANTRNDERDMGFVNGAVTIEANASIEVLEVWDRPSQIDQATSAFDAVGHQHTPLEATLDPIITPPATADDQGIEPLPDHSLSYL